MYDKKRVLALIIIIVVIIIAAVPIYSAQSNNQGQQPDKPQINENGSSNITNGTSGMITISIQNSIFNPDSITLKTGTNV